MWLLLLLWWCWSLICPLPPIERHLELLSTRHRPRTVATCAQLQLAVVFASGQLQQSLWHYYSGFFRQLLKKKTSHVHWCFFLAHECNLNNNNNNDNNNKRRLSRRCQSCDNWSSTTLDWTKQSLCRHLWPWRRLIATRWVLFFFFFFFWRGCVIVVSCVSICLKWIVNG